MMMEIPTDLVLAYTPVGATKMPLPMMVPATRFEGDSFSWAEICIFFYNLKEPRVEVVQGREASCGEEYFKFLRDFDRSGQDQLIKK